MEEKHRISTKALLETNGAGRNLLAYILRAKPFKTLMVLNKEEIVKYYRTSINESYARPLNVTRGIQNLEEIGIIEKQEAENGTKEVYRINWDLLCL